MTSRKTQDQLCSSCADVLHGYPGLRIEIRPHHMKDSIEMRIDVHMFDEEFHSMDIEDVSLFESHWDRVMDKAKYTLGQHIKEYLKLQRAVEGP